MYKTKCSMAINCRFIAEMVFCFIPQDLRLLKMKCNCLNARDVSY